MTRKKYRICFECGDEFIIIPLEKVMCFLDDKGGAERIFIPKKELCSDGYARYLERVLNTNRHLPQFSYKYAGESPIGERGILKIMQRQLAVMTMNGEYCFKEVRLVYDGGKVAGFRLLTNEKSSSYNRSNLVR